MQVKIDLKKKKIFKISNIELTKNIVSILNLKEKKTLLIFTSTNLIKSNSRTDYNYSKFVAEQVIKKKLIKVHSYKILRMPNIFGKWAKPNFNSVVATFCYNISRNLPITIIKNKKIDFCYIDDLVFLLEKIINKKLKKVQFKTYNCKISTLAEKIKKIKKNRFHSLKDFSKSKFDKYLYATYLSYIPLKDIVYKLKSHQDNRGDFVELFKYPGNGQISYFSIGPRITRGGHYHNTKVEKFFITDGKVIFDFYNINTKKKFSIKVNSKDLVVLETIPGHAHSIRNMEKKISKGIIWSNEVFDKKKPDTINN